MDFNCIININLSQRLNMMLVLEPNGTLVMYCGMVKVRFAGSIFCWIPRHLCTIFLIPNPNTWPACQDLSFFSNQDLGRQASLPIELKCLAFRSFQS